MNRPLRLISAAGIMAVLAAHAVTAGVGESAVITLVFPPGARATGLGEAFTGLSDDVNATFFNPAGLGQPPMANTWHVYLQDEGYRFTAISARRKKAFELREEVWAGTNRGVLRYNGRAWQGFETHLIEEGDELVDVIERFFGERDETWVDSAMLELKRVNGIDQERRRDIIELLDEEFGDTVSSNELSVALADRILLIDNLERSATKVYGLIAGKVDSTRADTLADQIGDILDQEDTELEDLVELEVPFSIAVTDSVTALVLDESNQVWVGTPNGLWRYDGSSWKGYTVLEGLPSNNIRTIAVGEYGSVAVGTDRGVGVYSQGLWSTLNGLEDTLVSAVAYGAREKLYIGTRKGVAVIGEDSVWTVYDTADGLLAQQVTALHIDEEDQLWVGSPEGVTVYNRVAWKRYKFPGSRVNCIQEYRKGRVWIGTDHGVIRYRPRRPRTDKDGKVVERPPEWKVFHSKKGLSGNDVSGIAVHGRDVWLTTDKAVNHYDNAEKQFMSFYEPLLPAFGIRDLWHLYFAGAWPTEDWGTIGLTINYINMGVNEWYDELGRQTGSARSWEGVFGLSYGLALRRDFSLGLNLKYVNSALAPGLGGTDSDEGIGRTFAADVALLKRNLLLRGLDIGFMAQNMGPAIFYINEDDSDPIPFQLRLGLAYRALDTPVHDLTILLDLYREFVKNYPDQEPDPFYVALFTSLGDDYWTEEIQEIQVNLGLEYWYVRFLALRLGFLFDYVGERYELTFGLGLRYGSLNFDWSYIHAPEGMLKGFLKNFDSSKTGATGARHGQWRVSFIVRL